MIDFIVRDFQALVEAKIRVKGLTLLLGESSAGKSSFLRAVFSATNNRFKQGQVRYGQDHATVKVRTTDSSDVLTVTRPWAGSIAMQLGDTKFNKLGRTLPKEINDFLNLGFIQVDNDRYSLHFHDQFQKPLLLEFSQKKVMDILSASKDLDDLILTKDYIQDLRVQNKGAFKAVDAILNEAKANLSNVSNKIDRLQFKVEKLSNLLKVVSSIKISLTALEDLHFKLCDKNSLSDSIALYEKYQLVFTSKLTEQNALDNVWLIQDSFNKLIKIENKHQIINKFISLYDPHKYDSLNKVSTLQINLQSIITIIKRLEILSDKVIKLKEILDIKEKINKGLNLKSKISLIEVCQNSNVDLDNRISSLNFIVENKICPVCGSKVQ